MYARCRIDNNECDNEDRYLIAEEDFKMQLTKFDQFIVFAIILLLITLIFVSYFNRKRERAKRKAELIFGGTEKKPKRKKSPNVIIGTLINLSKAFFKLFPILGKILPTPKGKALKAIEFRLDLSGNPFGLDVIGFVRLKVFTALVFFFILSIVALGNSRYDYFIWALVFGIVGYYYPDFYLKSLIEQRKRRISRELPDAMDFISLSLAAGMNFQLAVDEYIRRNDTLLADEFSIFSNNIRVGMSRVEAFQQMLGRNESDELRSFLSSVIQAERLGTPLRPVITSQAEELRIKRRQVVEKAIASAPVKMLFPLILFILPAMMVIVMGSVLLPSSKSEKGVTFTTEKYIYYRVTPQVKVTINGNDSLVLHVKKILEGNESTVNVEPFIMLTSSEEKYLKDFFNKNKNISEAYFVRIELPENSLVYLNMEITAPNGVKSRKLLVYKYIKFELTDFTDSTILSKSKKISFSGNVSVDCKVNLSLNGKPIPLKSFDENNGSFLSKEAILKGGTNKLVARITDNTGMSFSVSNYIKYAGVEVRADFKEKSATFETSATLIGEATKNCIVAVKKEIIEKGKVSYEEVAKVNVGEDGNFETKVSLEPGLNKFLIYAEKDGLESPYLRREITRKLIE